TTSVPRAAPRSRERAPGGRSAASGARWWTSGRGCWDTTASPPCPTPTRSRRRAPSRRPRATRPTMTTTPLLELWHRAGRAARDDRKRLLALYGVLLTPLALVLGSLAYRVLAWRGLALPALARPIAYVLEPLRAAWLADADLDVLLYLLLQ